MRQIMPHLLWVGHGGDSLDFRPILDAGIQAVIQLAAEELPLPLPRDLVSCHFPLIDGPGNDPKILHLATATVTYLLQKKIATLLCCGAGLSRSPAVAAAALANLTQEPPDDCLKKVASHTPTDIAPAFWLELKNTL